MLGFLKNHPFPVKAHFDSSLVLTFAVPKKYLQTLIPSCLELDTFNDAWAFIAVAMVQTKQLRPSIMPKFMGNNFFLIGYRIFVKYTNKAGKRLRGLYILKSETNKKKMEFIGNLFTHYQYSTTDILLNKSNGLYSVQSQKSAFKVVVSLAENAQLPSNSPFNNWKEARRFAGPLPFTFTCFPEKKEVLIIQGDRQNWIPKPVEVENYQFQFIQDFSFSEEIVLANAFIIKNIPYQWKKGKIEKY